MSRNEHVQEICFCHLYGRDFVAETDHKPLEIVMRKLLQSTPLRVQRMRIRLQRYNLTVKYKPENEIPVAADTLLRRRFV